MDNIMKKYDVRMVYDKDFSSEELNGNMYLYENGEFIEEPFILEKNGTITYRGVEYEPVVYPIYVPDSMPNIPQSILKQGKTFWVPYNSLVRTTATGMKWHLPSKDEHHTIIVAGDIIDFLIFDMKEGGVKWIRLIGTIDPFQEEPRTSSLHYVCENGSAVITGAVFFAERLHIPAEIDGIPVSEVRILKCSKYLREFVVAEGVSKIYLSAASPFMEIFDTPESAVWDVAPANIQYTAWYANQPDGEVYFNGYFCGIKGHTWKK